MTLKLLLTIIILVVALKSERNTSTWLSPLTVVAVAVLVMWSTWDGSSSSGGGGVGGGRRATHCGRLAIFAASLVKIGDQSGL